MLQEMRKYAKSWVANIFLGLLTLSFVTWGVGDIISGRTDTAVAKVGGRAIDQQEFARDYRNALRSEGDRRGQALSPDEARRLGVGDAILQQNISRTALDNVVDNLGLTASDAMVTATIHRYPVFSGLTGQFDRQVFQRAIDRIGYTEQGFIELVRSDTARTQLVRAIEGGFAVPPGYARVLFSYFTEVRAADYIVVDSKALAKIRTPSDAELMTYVKAHPNQFSTPEYRDVTYAWIGPDDVSAQIKVSDDQIKQAYDEHKDEYVKPEKRDLEQLLFAKEEDAKAAYAKAQKGSFDQLTDEKGKKPSALKDMSADDLVDPAIGKAVFALPKGGISQPVKAIAGGWSLYRVVNITPGSTRTFDQAKDEIRGRIVREMAESKLTDITNAYTDASSSGLSLTEAAKKVGMHTARIPAMDANGLAPDGSKTAGADDAAFKAQVFRTEVGEEGDPQPSDKTGIYYVVSVNGSIPPKLKALDQVRAQALEGWTNQERAVLLKAKAQELAAQANRDDSLVAAAKSIGVTIQKSPALNHTSTNDVFSQPLVASVFQAKPGQTVFGPKAKSGDYVVAKVTGIMHPSLPEKSPGYIQAVREMSANISGGFTESFIDEQKNEQGVKINNKLLNSVIGSEGS